MRRLFAPRALWNVLLAGFIVRWVGLERQSLSLEEAREWSAATRGGWRDTLTADPGTPPLGRLLLRAWTSVWGDAEDRLRMPAAIVGALAVLLGWRVGLALLSPTHAPRRGPFPRMDDRGAGARLAVWWAGSLALAPGLAWVGQQALPHALLLAETLALLLLYLRWLDRGGRVALLGLTLVGAAALHTHLAAALVLVGLVCHAVALRVGARETAGPATAPSALPLLASALAALALAVPWIVWSAANASEPLTPPAPPGPIPPALEAVARVAAGPGLLVLDAERRALSAGALLQEEGVVAGWIALTWLGALLLGLVRQARGHAGGGLVVWLALAPLALRALAPDAVSLSAALGLSGPWLLLIAFSGAFALPRLARLPLLVLLALLAAAGLLAVHGADDELTVTRTRRMRDADYPTEVGPDPADPLRFLNHGHPPGNEPWNEVVKLVRHFAEAGDLVVLGPGLPTQVGAYYAQRDAPSGREWRALPRGQDDARALLASGWGRLPERRRVLLVASPAANAGPTPQALYRLLFQACGAAWNAAGAAGFDALPPFPLHRAEGLVVALLERR